MKGPRIVPHSRMSAIAVPVLALALAFALSGCLSFGKDPPDTLFNLTPARVAAAKERFASLLDEQSMI